MITVKIFFNVLWTWSILAIEIFKSSINFKNRKVSWLVIIVSGNVYWYKLCVCTYFCIKGGTFCLKFPPPPMIYKLINIMFHDDYGRWAYICEHMLDSIFYFSNINIILPMNCQEVHFENEVKHIRVFQFDIKVCVHVIEF